eukprot:Amastigsp_a843362_48.p3 type:complete len:111 gc:universal Amastigsp_a843362_48:423-91(-)
MNTAVQNPDDPWPYDTPGSAQIAKCNDSKTMSPMRCGTVRSIPRIERSAKAPFHSTSGVRSSKGPPMARTTRAPVAQTIKYTPTIAKHNEKFSRVHDVSASPWNRSSASK